MGPKLFFIAVIFLLLTPMTSATSYCINTTHKYSETIKNVTFGGTDYGQLAVSGTDYCPGGCVNGACKPLADNNIPAFAAMFAVFAFILIYVGLNLGKDHAILSWLFIPMGLVMMVVGIFVIIEQGAFSGSVVSILSITGFALIIMLITVLAYLFLRLSTEPFKMLKKYSKKRKGKR